MMSNKEIRKLLRKVKVRLKDFLGNIVYTFLFLFYKKKERKTLYYSSICAIFKDESRFLKEWLEYHRLIGIEHFYLYNNFSTDNYKEILRPYVDNNIVTLIEWPVKYGQIPAYEDFRYKYKSESRWVAFIDLDEFICPYEEKNIGDWLKKFEKYPSIKIYWKMFGTNGIIEADSNKCVIEQYTNSWKGLRNAGKIIWNTDFEPHEMYMEHLFCQYKIFGKMFRLPSINESYHFISCPNAEKTPQNNTLQLNHYWSKSILEYIKKTNRGDAYSEEMDANRLDLEFFYQFENKNISEDKKIYRFLAQLKIRLGMVKLEFSRRYKEDKNESI